MSPIFLADKILDNQHLLLENKEEIFHLIRVLRYKKGEEIIIRSPDGELFLTSIEEVEKDRVVFKILEKYNKDIEIKFNLFLCQSLPKLDKWEWIIEKCTELGVSGFFPLQTERSIVNLKEENIERKYKRWEKIIIEAVKQSERKRIPVLSEVKNLEELLNHIDSKDSSILVAWEKSEVGLKNVIKEVKDNIYLFIGPEGSFSDREIQMFKERGGVFFNMGPRILKVETAAIVASSLILYEKGGLGLE
ncbi:MAG: hypothetical protein CBR30_01910 [Dictyoglomus sp. NZ13-RE01]|nr:MAG: hypothetical protein CBR30_01910 [Dictyoglomus sp. NZ13-RE01]